MPLMKIVQCPNCKKQVRVQAEARGPVQQYRGAPEYFWPVMACEECKSYFEYNGDPKRTDTRPKPT